MASEWEEPEKLSKNELIIELVRQRWLYRRLKRLLGSLSEDEGWYADIEGQAPSEEWRITGTSPAIRRGI